MIATSPAFTAAANADINYPRAKCDILFTDTVAQFGSTVTTTSMNNCAGLSSTITDTMLLQTIDSKDITPKKFIVNDGTWINDGTWYPCPGSIEELSVNQFGWYTAEVSDSSGDFGTPPELRIDFGTIRAINQIRVFGLSVAGLPVYNQYPTAFEIEIRDESNELLNTTTEFTSDSVEKVIDFAEDEIFSAKYIILRLVSWSEPNTVGKITEFFGVIASTVYGDDIVSMDILEELEDDGQMSINEMNLELQNVDILDLLGQKLVNPYLPDNTGSYLQNAITSNVRLRPYLGFKLTSGSVEYVPMGSYWSTDWKVSEWKYEASITARDRMEFLRLNSFTFDDVPISATLYQVAEKVLNHAKTNIPLNDLTWSIDSYLSIITIPYTWFGKNVTYFEALRLIAQTCLGRCYVNRNDVLVIESFLADNMSGAPDITITSDDYISCDRPVKNSSVKYRVVVPVSELVLSSEGEITTTDEFSFGALDTSTSHLIEWGDDAVLNASASIDGATGVAVTLTNITYYSWGCRVTANKSSGTSGTYKIKVTGKKLELNKTVEVEAVNNLYSEKDADKKTDRLPQNFLVQTVALAQIVADTKLHSASDPSNECTVETFGNPAIEIGDIADIEVYSKLNVVKEFRIVKQQHKYDGGLRSMITGKKTVQLWN